LFPFGQVGAEVDMFKQATQLHNFCNTDYWEKGGSKSAYPADGGASSDISAKAGV